MHLLWRGTKRRMAPCDTHFRMPSRVLGLTPAIKAVSSTMQLKTLRVGCSETRPRASRGLALGVKWLRGMAQEDVSVVFSEVSVRSRLVGDGMWIVRLYDIDDCGRSDAACGRRREVRRQKGPPGRRRLKVRIRTVRASDAGEERARECWVLRAPWCISGGWEV
jgi:hypothetical protein